MKTAIALFLMVLTLTGCESMPQQKLIVQVSAMKYIEDGEDRAGRAAAVIEEVQRAKVLIDFDGVTLDQIKGAVLDRLKERSLNPSDMLLAMAIVDMASAELDVKLGAGILSPEQKVTVNEVLGWVEQAASFY